MNEKGNCTAMELMCLERAKADHKDSQKWLARGERWHDLARAENAWRHQKSPAQQAMHAGPMAMQPNVSRNPARQQQG
jgi:hypothetical protein